MDLFDFDPPEVKPEVNQVSVPTMNIITYRTVCCDECKASALATNRHCPCPVCGKIL